jgi:hypothetical protein
MFTQTIAKLIALLLKIIKAFLAFRVPVHLYEFIVSNMKEPDCEDKPPKHFSTTPEAQEF